MCNCFELSMLISDHPPLVNPMEPNFAQSKTFISHAGNDYYNIIYIYHQLVGNLSTKK